MHREMRRKDRELTREEAVAMLEKAEYGILSTLSSDGTPYGVPISFILENNTIYLHMAKTGHKLDNILANPAVSFSVVGPAEPVVEGDSYSTFFESAIAFGKARLVEDAKEIRDALYILTEKYFPDNMDVFEASIAGNSLSRLYVVAIDIEHLSAKAKKKM